MKQELKWNADSGLQCQSWIDRGITHGFSFDTAHRPTEIYYAKQVHGTFCQEVLQHSEAEDVAKIQADALTTKLSEQTLAVQTADCLPILVVDFLSGRIAAIHAGWRGLAARILSEYFNAFQADRSQVEVLIGPSISFSMFEVGPEVVTQMKSSFPELPSTEWNAYIGSGEGDRSFIDLAQLAKWDIASLGVSIENISVSKICTKSDLSWNSYRRNGAAAGRNWAWIGRKS